MTNNCFQFQFGSSEFNSVTDNRTIFHTKNYPIELPSVYILLYIVLDTIQRLTISPHNKASNKIADQLVLCIITFVVIYKLECNVK